MDVIQITASFIATVVWKYFIVKKIFMGNGIHENLLHENFLTRKMNKVPGMQWSVIYLYMHMQH